MKITTIAKVVSVLACTSLAASSQTLHATFSNVNPGESVTGSFNAGSSFGTYHSGVMNFDYADAFCVDPAQFIYAGETVNYTIEPLSWLPNSSSISKVVGGFLASAKTSLDAAGAQWAIWEIIGDGIISPSFASGSVLIANEASSAVATRALAYLNNLSSLPSTNLLYATSPTRQDMVFMVPELSSTVLGALGAMTLLVRRRR